MGHHMVSNMVKVQQALQAVDPTIYVYGEGWNFGEVANNARGVNATQLNLAGTGIGTFSDRLRDAVRGGGPFDGGDDLVPTRASSTASGTTRTNSHEQGSDRRRRPSCCSTATRSASASPATWPTTSSRTAPATP